MGVYIKLLVYKLRRQASLNYAMQMKATKIVCSSREKNVLLAMQLFLGLDFLFDSRTDQGISSFKYELLFTAPALMVYSFIVISSPF